MDAKPACTYGAKCYRKNPDHFEQFSHPLPSPSPSTSSDATKKRSGDNDGSAGDAKKAKLAKPILILLPGASGALAKDFAETVLPLLEKSFEVRLRAAGKWQGWDVTKNARAVVTSICPKEADAPAWFVLGCSFGNRVAAAIVAEALTPVPPALILTGYPMYGEKGTDERVRLLRDLPSSARALCISGEADEFITKNVPAGQPRGEALWAAVVATMACAAATTVHIVPKGGHGCLPSGKGAKAAAAEQMLGWIHGFVGLGHCSSLREGASASGE